MRLARFTKGLSISLDSDQYQRIKGITDRRGISIAEWFRAMAEEALRLHSMENGSDEKRVQARGGSKQWPEQV
jgi:hypothetical protein